MTAATNQHYDITPEVFGLFLGRRRKYSAGLYFSPDDSLDAAQEQKLHFVAGRLDLSPGRRLLDVGCGWGSLVLFAAQEYGARVSGISPAARQHEYIAGQVATLGLGDLVDTVVGRFEDHGFPPGSFDAVSMLGSIVHMPDPDEAFDRARRALRAGGLVYVSESCFRNAAVRRRFDERPGTEFVRSTIFGNGELRPLSELVAAAENAGLSVVAVDDLTDHYRRTIEHWLEQVRLRREAIDQLRPGIADDLAHYLEIANAGWGYTTKHYALTCRRTR